MRLQGKVAVITGPPWESGGDCKLFAQEGARLVLCAVTGRPETPQQLAPARSHRVSCTEQARPGGCYGKAAISKFGRINSWSTRRVRLNDLWLP